MEQYYVEIELIEKPNRNLTQLEETEQFSQRDVKKVTVEAGSRCNMKGHTDRATESMNV